MCSAHNCSNSSERISRRAEGSAMGAWPLCSPLLSLFLGGSSVCASEQTPATYRHSLIRCYPRGNDYAVRPGSTSIRPRNLGENMEKLAALLALILFSFIAQAADTNTINKLPQLVKPDSGRFAYASNPTLTLCGTNGTAANMYCNAPQYLPTLAYLPAAEIITTMSDLSCTNLGGGVFDCGTSSYFYSSLGGSSIWWILQDFGYLGAIFVQVNN